MLIVGLDAASDPRKFGLVLCLWSGANLSLMAAGTLGDAALRTRLDDELRVAERALLAVDAPLGWPAPLAAALATHRAGEAVPASQSALFRRATDIAVHAATGKLPLEVGADRIARAAWQAGLGLTLDAIPADARVLVLGDVPSPGRSVPRCLEAHPTDMSRCERLLAASRGPGFDAAEQAAAEEHGARFQSPVGVVCPYDPCPAILGRTLVWRDRSHLTATISRQLAPTIRRYVEAALRD